MPQETIPPSVLWGCRVAVGFNIGVLCAYLGVFQQQGGIGIPALSYEPKGLRDGIEKHRIISREVLHFSHLR